MMPSAPFKRLSFAEAYRLYGIDKPDLRIPWTIVDCTERLMFLNSSNVEKFVARLFIAKGLAKRITRANRAEWKRLIEMNIKGQVSFFAFQIFERISSLIISFDFEYIFVNFYLQYGIHL